MASTPNYPKGYFSVSDTAADSTGTLTLELATPANVCVLQSFLLTVQIATTNITSVTVSVDGVLVSTWTPATGAAQQYLTGESGTVSEPTITLTAGTGTLVGTLLPTMLSASKTITIVVSAGGYAMMAEAIITGIEYGT